MSLPRNGTWLVDWIRSICARELDADQAYPFFHCDYLEGETPDAAIERLFLVARSECRTDLEAVLLLCHG